MSAQKKGRMDVRGCWGDKDRGREEGSAVPLGVIVEARLNGAGAGKVSAQQGRLRRKYHSCMEG